MTNKQYKDWLNTHYPRQRQQFVADFNATAAAIGVDGQSETTLTNTWVHNSDRNPPAEFAGLPFDLFLSLVLQRRENPDATKHIHLVPVVLSESEEEALIRTAKKAESTPDEFLRICAQIGFEDQCGIE